jgi:8-oxo-dGTP pyrophosphatase MutT (NUDIX family)/DNA-binding XRE family transcriptional regulator
MEVVDQWTGRHARALQIAARMTQEELADLLGVARRTVAAWHERPEIVLRPELQRALDTAYARMPESVKVRFVRQLRADEAADSAAGVTLSVAIAVVLRQAEVLLVRRRESDPSGITWQFPAGVVKPEAVAETVAVRETLAETGVHCAVRAWLGRRVHPITQVNCDYFLCDYLAGTAENRDPEENLSVLWVPAAEVTRFIPVDRLFEPVANALQEAAS